MNGELPEGWASATLGEICSKPQYGWTTRASKTGKLRYIRTTDISKGGIDWTTVPYCEEAPDDIEKYRIKPDDILVSRAGSVGVSHRVRDVPYDAVFASYLIRFQPLAGISPEFVEFFLKSDAYWRSISEFSAGIAIPNVNASKLASLEIPLAPAAEQRRIAARLREVLETVRGGHERLKNTGAILTRFRQSVLAAACSGLLTVDWRRQHSGGRNADLDSLLRKRKRLWEERELTKLKAAARPPKGDTWKRRYQSPFSLASDALELPDTWVPVTVSHVAFLDVGFAFKSAEYSDRGIRLLRGENLEPGRLRWADTRYWPKAKLRGFEHLLVENGEIILALDRPVISSGLKIARVTETDLPCLLVQRMMRFKMVDPDLTQWLFYNLQNHSFIKHISSGLTGSDLPHVTGTGVAEYTFGLPSRDERQEIIRRVEELLTFAAEIEQALQGAESRVEILTSALLAKAFGGELVPTEAELAEKEHRTYESASELLQQVAAQGQRQERQLRGGNMPRKKASSRSSRARRPLVEIVRENKRITPDQLFKQAGFDADSVDAFYGELRTLIDAGSVIEKRPNKKDIYLEIARK